MLIAYEGLPGEHVSMSAKNAIALAAKHNRKVRMRFNGISLTVNKRLSVKHVVGTWQHMLDAKQLRLAKLSRRKGGESEASGRNCRKAIAA